ncbi:hypothetical protein ACHHYP_15954 [Achlya hypogyna]|uniref:Uncharacterized protein n=1 Tax=Achlya hypogyna TaxID=1202772 RepID=A0A1V9Y9Q8_ACHHY|nr:hypothetical protein ACHHYP_15954 [Achlya hypogyna]
MDNGAGTSGQASRPTAPKEIEEYEASTKAMKSFNEALRQLSDNLEEMTQSVEQTNTITSAWLSLWHK